MSAARALAGCLAVAAAVSSGAALAPTAVAAQADAPSANCPDAVTSDAGIWIVGQVRDPGSEVPLPGAEVEVTWREAGELRRATTEAGPAGDYRFCGIPPELHLTVSASAVGRAGGMHAVDTRAGEPVVRQDLAVVLADAERGRIVGRVVDRGNRRGVEAATVRLEPPGLEVATRYDGRFTLQDVPAGDHTLHLTHLAYGEHETEVTVEPDRTVEVEMAVSEEPVELEPLEVTVRHRYRPLERRGYYERMHWAEAHGGVFLTPEIIERRKPSKLSHLLGHVPMVALNRICSGGACGNQVVIRGCGVGGRPAVFLDGIEYDFARGSVRGIDEIPMQDIRAVEVYRSPGEIPGEFYTTSAHCAVVLWTK